MSLPSLQPAARSYALLSVGAALLTLSLVAGDGNLRWFGVMHTFAAGGDGSILWSLRRVKAGMMVADHPSRAGCYVIET